MRVKILHPAVTFGDVGDVVDPPEGFVVRAAVKAGLVELAPKPKKASKKGAKTASKKGDV